MPHFLQSDAWQRVQESLGRPTARLRGEGWDALAVTQRGRINSRVYVPYGPQLSDPEALAPALASLRAFAREQRATFLRVEPMLESGAPALSASDLARVGLRRVSREQPEHTQRVRLQRPFDEVLGEMRKTNRNLHRNFAKKGLSVRESRDPADIEHLIRLLGEVTDRTGMHAHASDYLRTQAHVLVPHSDATIYLVDHAEAAEPVAASLVYDDAERRYYGHAAADTAHRALSPGVILVTSMMQAANEAGQREFDLYGVVPPEVRDHAWSGFSDFKRSFGGAQVDFSGTWEMPVRALGYAAYRMGRRVLG